MRRSVLARLLHPLRGRSGVEVNFPPDDGIGLGNLLTYWFWAYRRRLEQVDAFVARTDAMAPWLEVFPALEDLVIERSMIPFTANRRHEMRQDFEEDHREDLENFIRFFLLSSPRWPERPPVEPGVVTINVRRGDYYSEPRWRALYGFDVAAYVRLAVQGSKEQAFVDLIRVVSDDPRWCRQHLAFLSNYADLEFQDPEDGPVENLLQLSQASRLVLANSSFSYWAAYMSNAWHRGGHDRTWAPWFHRRDFLGGAAWQLDPRWSVVRDIPGGW